MDVAVQTVDLRKTYLTRSGRRVAVEGLTMAVPAGGVHGFLGPNGSGKTTTIRMLLGLLRPDSGTAQLFGQSVPQNLPAVINRVGAIVESPKFFPAFSGRQNLRLLADGIGTPRARIDEVLEATNLRERGRDHFSSYSLGMKQRLAIAATLLKDPDLLIFDEPTNGLDPAGIREVRDTMRSLGDSGRTVLVSSHILAEVEHVADTVTIIARGRTLAEGTVAEILGNSSMGSRVRIQVAHPGLATDVLQSQGFPVTADKSGLLVGTTDPAAVTRALAERGLYLSELTPMRADLESAFLELTSGQGLDRAATPPDSPPGPDATSAQTATTPQDRA